MWKFIYTIGTGSLQTTLIQEKNHQKAEDLFFSERLACVDARNVTYLRTVFINTL